MEHVGMALGWLDLRTRSIGMCGAWDFEHDWVLVSLSERHRELEGLWI